MIQDHACQIRSCLRSVGVTPQAGIMTWHRPKTAVQGAQRGNPVVMALTGHAYFDTAESKLPGEPPTATWITRVDATGFFELLFERLITLT